MRTGRLRNPQISAFYILSIHISQKHNMPSTKSDIDISHLGICPYDENGNLRIPGFASRADRDRCTTKSDQVEMDDMATDTAKRILNSYFPSQVPKSRQLAHRIPGRTKSGSFGHVRDIVSSHMTKYGPIQGCHSVTILSHRDALAQFAGTNKLAQSSSTALGGEDVKQKACTITVAASRELRSVSKPERKEYIPGPGPCSNVDR